MAAAGVAVGVDAAGFTAAGAAAAGVAAAGVAAAGVAAAGVAAVGAAAGFADAAGAADAAAAGLADAAGVCANEPDEKMVTAANAARLKLFLSRIGFPRGGCSGGRLRMQRTPRVGAASRTSSRGASSTDQGREPSRILLPGAAAPIQESSKV